MSSPESKSQENMEQVAVLSPITVYKSILALDDPIWLKGRRKYLTYQDRLQHIPEMIPILQEVGAAYKPFPEVIPMPSQDEVKEMMIQDISDFYSYAEEIGVVSHQVNQLQLRTSAVGNIIVTSEGERQGSVDWDEKTRTSFPDNPEEGIAIQMNPAIMEYYTKWYAAIAQAKGIQIDTEMLRDAIIGMLAVHERAHILEGALKTQLTTFVVEDEAFNYISSSWSVLDLTYLPASTVSEDVVPGASPKSYTRRLAHAERFSTGFEMMALEFFLTKFGVGEAASKQMVEAVLEMKNIRKEAIKNIYRDLYKKRFTEERMELFVADVRSLSEEVWDETTQLNISLRGQDEDTLWTWVGYHAPYTPDELRYILSEAYAKLTPEYARELLLEGE